MNKFVSLILFASFFSINGFSQKNFPQIIGETMDDKTITIPDQTKGKFTVIGLAYSRKAEDNLKTWLNPSYNKFISPNRALDYDINLYFLPIFTGANQSLSKTAKKKVQEETDPELHPYILFFKGNVKIYKKELNIDDKDLPYFFVLDTDGNIVYSTSGRYTEKKMDAIDDAIE